MIAPSLCGLYARYPQLHLNINTDDRMADMVRGHADLHFV